MKKIYLVFCTGVGRYGYYTEAQRRSHDYGEPVSVSLAEMSANYPIWSAANSLDDVVKFLEFKDDGAWCIAGLDYEDALGWIRHVVKRKDVDEDARIDLINGYVEGFWLTWIESGEEI